MSETTEFRIAAVVLFLGAMLGAYGALGARGLVGFVAGMVWVFAVSYIAESRR